MCSSDLTVGRVAGRDMAVTAVIGPTWAAWAVASASGPQGFADHAFLDQHIAIRLGVAGQHNGGGTTGALAFSPELERTSAASTMASPIVMPVMYIVRIN